MLKWSLGRITAFVWLFFAGVLLRVIFLEAWKMATQEARHALFAAILFLAIALVLSILYCVRRDLADYAKRARQEEKEKAEKAAAAKKQEEKEAKKGLKSSGFRVHPVVWYLVIGGFVALLLGVVPRFISAPEPPATIYFSDFLTAVEEGKVADVFITSREGGTREVVGRYSADHRAFRTVDPGYSQDLVPFLHKYKVKILAEHAARPSLLSLLFVSAWPMLLIIGVWIYFMSRIRMGPMGGGNPLQKKTSKLGEKPTTRFTDVAGLDEPKEEVLEVIEFLKNPQTFTALNAKIPRGLLLVGPSGCGKTLLAKAVAGESDVPFFSMSGSEFVEVFVGVGASRVRDLFEQAKKSAPCIVFIDEIDAVGRHRGAGFGGGNDEREQTLNQLLVAMDGFEPNSGIIVIAATNRPDILDPALLRPGRFDRRIIVDNPDSKGRKEILEVHLRYIPVASDVRVESLVKQTPGFSGADLASVVNEGALLAARRGKKLVNMVDFEEAIERVIAGPSRRSKALIPKERAMVAHHEAGHALLRKLLPHADPPQKVTIVSRGMALGYVIGAPPDDRYTRTKLELMDEIAVAMGGRVAEELVFEDITTGAANDFEQATDMAHRMVTSFGMSEKLGRVTLGKRGGPIFLGRDLVESRNYSEEIAREIDREVRRITDECYERARQTIGANRDKLERIAQALLERETLSAEDLDVIMNQTEG